MIPLPLIERGFIFFRYFLVVVSPTSPNISSFKGWIQTEAPITTRLCASISPEWITPFDVSEKTTIIFLK